MTIYSLDVLLFPIWNQSVVPCPVLTVASWPAHRFLKRQVRWSGIPISFRIFQFVMIHTVKGFGIVNEAEVDVFLELSCFFCDPTGGNLICGSSAFGSTVTCCRVRRTEYDSGCTSPFEEVVITFVTPTIVWPQAKQHGGNTAPPINRKLDLRFTEHGPAHQNKTQVPPQSVSPIRKLPEASYPYPSGGRQNENHRHRKLTKLVTWITALSNSRKLWAMQCKATQDRRDMVESSDKTWSTGEGNGKPL